MKTCPYCAEEIQAAAVVCKHCGRDLSPAPRATRSGPSSGAVVAIALGIAALLAVALPILILIVGRVDGAAGERPGGQPTPTVEHSESLARTMCKEFVTDALKAPSTADFPWTGYATKDYGGGKYTVQSYVDAQNSFGATIRSRWSCTITYKGSGSGFLARNWTVNDLTIQ